jgi:hypothetical protein
MNPVSAVILTLALLFGGAGAVFAFESAARPDAAATSVTAATDGTSTAEASPVSRSGRHHRPPVRWAPCPAGTTLVENACVTDLVKTVTLPAPAAPAVSQAGSAATASHTSGHHEEDDEGDGRGEDGHHGGGDD